MHYANKIFPGFDFILLQIVLQEIEIMNQGKTVFAQIMSLIPRYEFDKCVKRYNGNRHAIEFKCRDQFMVMSFAQFTGQDSLRSIDATLVALSFKLYSSGIKYIQRSTLAHINGTKDWRIYHDFGQILIAQARYLYRHEPSRLDVDGIVYAFDSSTMKLCLQLCPWARLHHDKGGVKMHTLLDLRGAIPAFIHISDGKLHDVNVLDMLTFEAGAFYVMDRGYLDFARLYRLHQAGAFFVTRAKSNFNARRVYSAPCDRSEGVICDQRVALGGFYAAHDYPEHMRRIRFKDPDSGKTLVFLTNNTALPALTICALYKQRWQVELFFKWIKQHLRIKKFLGTSENAVKTQIWIAVCTYVLIAITKKRLHLDHHSLYEILQILSLTMLEKTPIAQLLTPPSAYSSLDFETQQLVLL